MTQDDHRRIQHYFTMWSWISASVAAAIALAIGIGLIYRDHAARQSTHVDTHVAATSRLLADVQRSLNRLNGLNLSDCAISPDGRYGPNLVAMHRELFLIDAVKDIGFFTGDKLACTTGRGLLGWPRTLPQPDIVTDLGDAIWLREPILLFEGDSRNSASDYAIFQRGDYNAIVDYRALVTAMVWPGDWQLVADYGDRQYSIVGNADLSQLPSGVGIITGDGILSRACGGTVGLHCITVRTSYTLLAQQYSGYLPGLLAFMLVAGLTGRALVYRRLKRRYSVTARVARGLDTGAFSPRYQAMVDLRTGQNVGCEVTAGFTDEFGEIPRQEFIQIVRELGRTWELTEKVLQQALIELAGYGDWARRFRISFNLFAEDLESGEALKLLEMPGFDHDQHRYVLEVREDVRLDGKAALGSLSVLDAGGFWMCVDHFGKGYSNVGMLTAAQCRWIKIDADFVAGIENRSAQSTLLPSMVSMALTQDIAVVALGVDNPAQIEALLESGINWGQGDALGQVVDIKTFHAQTQQASDNLIGHASEESPDHLI